VVFEDLHWADASTLDLLTVLMRRAAASSLLLVCTFRPEFHIQPEVAGRITHLTIARLDRAETEEMVTELLGEEPPAALMERIVERTDGVPLFVEEVVRELQEGGEVEVAAIPATLRDSLTARLDRLGDAKDVAQTAALLAREFPYALLAAVMPGDEAHLRAALDRLVDAGILYAAGDRYLFKHALLQDAAYESMLQSRRQELHERVARVLERGFDELVEVEPETVARHLTAAGRATEAIPHWLNAGERALDVAAYAEAEAHLVAGVRLVPELPDEHARRQTEIAFQLRLGAARMSIAGYGAPGTKEAFERAAALSTELDDFTSLAPALYGLAGFQIATGSATRAYEFAERLRRLATEAGDREVGVEADAIQGVAAFLLGRLDDALARFADALAAWDPEAHRRHTITFGQEPGVVALATQAMTLGFRGDVAAARRASTFAIGAARQIEHPLSLAYALATTGLVEQALGDVERAAAASEELLDVAQQHLLGTLHAWGLSIAGWATLRRGEVERGLEETLAGLEAAAALGFPCGVGHFAAALVDGCLRAGEGDGAAAALAHAEAAGDERIYHPELQRVRVAAALGQERDADRAEGDLRSALGLARELGAKIPEVRTAQTLAELLEARGRGDEGRELLAAALGDQGDAPAAPVFAEAAEALVRLGGAPARA
jgi:tetratricopeptide (TPR) repeat protein